METKAARKEAIRQFKERKTYRGAFAVRCTVTRRVWVGTSPNLDAAKNGIWFALRVGKHLVSSLQEEWTAHGEPAFEYEILEKLDDDTHPLAIADSLKEKKSHWISQLLAHPM